MPLVSNDRKHKEKAKRLKALRLAAGLEQEQLAQRLNVSRKKISNIENCHLEAMNNLKDDLFERWWRICRQTASENERRSFKEYITKLFDL